MILLEYRNIKIFLQNVALPILLRKFLQLKKVKNTVPWTYVIDDLNGEEIVGTFYKKKIKKTNQKEFTIEKVIIRKGDKLYVKWRGYNTLGEYLGENVKVDFGFYNYVTKADFKK